MNKKQIRNALKLMRKIIVHFKWYAKGIRKFKNDKYYYSKLNKRKEFNIKNEYMHPILTECYREAGSIGMYFYQDLWAARKIYQNNTLATHYDIGSRVDGFILALLSFREVTLIDIRPLPYTISGLRFIQSNATELYGIPDNSVMSLSALCSLEHFGLGRYGDPIDPEACFKAFESIQRVCAIGAKIYISLPVAHEDMLEFNAHRRFNPYTVINAFDKMTLKEFIVQKNSGETIYNPLQNKNWGNNDMDRGTGFFEFEKTGV